MLSGTTVLMIGHTAGLMLMTHSLRFVFRPVVVLCRGVIVLMPTGFAGRVLMTHSFLLRSILCRDAATANKVGSY